MNSASKIVLFSVLLPGGSNLELAEDADGSIILLRDGTIIPACRWPAGQVEKGVVAFRKYRRTFNETQGAAPVAA